jgi:hypothetical protein
MDRDAPVAQLDRALPSEGKGHTFESCRVRQFLRFSWSLSAEWPHNRFSRRSCLFTCIQSGTVCAWGRYESGSCNGTMSNRRARARPRHHAGIFLVAEGFGGRITLLGSLIP